MIADVRQKKPDVFSVRYISMTAGSKRKLLRLPISIGDEIYEVVMRREASIIRPNRQINLLELATPVCERKSRLNILNALDDGILLDIFETLHLIDLCAVANVCTRFNAIAKHVFAARFKNRTLRLLDFQYKIHQMETLTLLEQCFRTFGATLTSVMTRVQREELLNTSIVTEMVAEYCPNITELDIADVSIEPSALKAKRDIFCRLKKLTAFGGDFVTTEDGIEWQLEKLVLLECMNDTWLHIKMPKLMEIEFRQYHPRMGAPVICNFLSINSHIQHLVLNLDHLEMKELLAISASVPMLKMLTIRGCTIFQECPAKTDQFKYLKTLNLIRPIHKKYNSLDTLFEFIVKNAQIEHLTLEPSKLRTTHVKSVFDRICKMESLKTLVLDGVDNAEIGDEEFMRGIETLQQLEEVTIRPVAVGLECILRALREATQITKFDIRISEKMRLKLNDEICYAITELIESRPGLHVRVEVLKTSIVVSRETLLYTTYLTFL